ATLFPESRRTVDLSDVEILEAGTRGARVACEATAGIRAEIQAAASSPDTMLRPLAERLKAWQAGKTKVVFVAHSPSQGERLLFLLSKYRINVELDEKDAPGADLVDPQTPLRTAFEEVTVLLGEIGAGFFLPGANLAVISETEVFGERSHRRRAKQFADAEAIRAISDLKTNDLVVHKDYGIAVFKGIKRVESTEPARQSLEWLPGSGTGATAPPVDFVHLEYSGGDKLYVPVYKMSLVQKYTAGEGETVSLDKLGGTGWESRKKKVSVAVAKMAKELLDLYARREVARRPAFGVHPEVAAFEARFEFDETPDQLSAIEKIHEDLSSEKPMDRLVCGDVGYGKTEVALRAAARVALDGRQVAVLVPTTILAQQHGRTFAKRFADSPVRVRTLSRFQHPAESKEVLAGLAEGKIDVIVGTHRLLGKEVKFRDLGLVIVDEEHRFGVAHKERLKEMRAHVDVLTLSATPIPRTLHMSMSGLRDLSVIETPPEDRLPIRTFVSKWEGGIIREACMRELSRGGQIYFVHNRVHNIGAVASYVQKCVPEARIGIAHGQMAPDDLEKMMLDFVDKKYDVLVCTSIVESGLDIPSANTMIINRADRFGLAQLYQLRGRVGRGATRAYCVMLVPPGDVLSADALERLSAMQEYTELGSGFRVAQRDLEIRGAGNLLGTSQSGFIHSVGFDLYVSLLKKEVDKLRGQEPEPELEPEINLKVAALIPDGYIQDARFRVGFYRRLSAAKDEEEISTVRDELRDRFGVLPGEVDNLVDVLRLRRQMQRMGIRDLSFDGKDLVLTFADRTKVSPERLVRMAAKEPKKYRLTPDQKFRARVTDREKTLADAKGLLTLLS
ncbi:MAG TPA: transcription-repair coupling factor, partial [bacterium]|nr:transcription-repair coupling factor [bacterium]